MNKLRGMLDFVMWMRGMTTTEICEAMPTRFKAPEFNGDIKECANEWIGMDAIKWHVVGEYGKFISRRITPNILMPLDSDGYLLELPAKPLSPAKDEEWDKYTALFDQYQEAEKKVLFKVGTIDIEDSDDGRSIAYCIGKEAVLVKFFWPDGSVTWDDCGIETIEDLVYNMESEVYLTLRAIKEILK